MERYRARRTNAWGRRRAGIAAALAAACALALSPSAALAHGDAGPRPTITSLLTEWEFDVFVVIGLIVAAWLYWFGVSAVSRVHPNSPIPRRRVVSFYAGLAATVVALMSPIARYDTTLFSVHMWQHLVLMLVAAPLLIMGAPITLLLRAVPRRVRVEVILPILHSHVVRVVTHPVLAWVLFAATMWITHFSPIYNDALDNIWLHRLEHLWYMAAALLFWWPVIGVDPTPLRLNHPVRLVYTFLQMPQSAFLAVAIYSTDRPMYQHYVDVQRDWGPSPLADQQLAAVSMWVFGDVLFIAAAAIVAVGWMRHEEREAERQDRAQARAALARSG